MTDKAKEAIDDVLHDIDHGNITIGEARAKICAIVDDERKGEVVLGIVEPYSYCHQVCIPEIDITTNELSSVIGKRGELVFRPREE